MRLQQVNNPAASKVPSGKNFPGANEPTAVNRLAGADARVVHPKLNTKPNSISYAQARTEPKLARSRGKGRSFKRRLNQRRGRR